VYKSLTLLILQYIVLPSDPQHVSWESLVLNKVSQTGGLIQVRNLMSVISVIKFYAEEAICQVIAAFSLVRNLTGASTAGNTSVVVDF
jgi:hypothetical protein